MTTNSLIENDGLGIGFGEPIVIHNLPVDEMLVSGLVAFFEETHCLSDLDPFSLGYRASLASYNKLISKGAKPLCLQAAISLPEMDNSWLEQFFAGSRDCCSIYGGELLSYNFYKGKCAITLNACGTLKKDLYTAASSIDVGDLIFVTGSLGDASLAKNRVHKGIPNDDSITKYLLNRLLRPTIDLDFALALKSITTSSTDILAGLAVDINKLFAGTDLGANISMLDIPISEQMRTIIEINAAYHYALTGLDDYELCFTISPNNSQALAKLAQEHCCHIAQIGVVIAQDDTAFIDHNGLPINLG
jgi:thiamine-monophosphate kinase